MARAKTGQSCETFGICVARSGSVVILVGLLI